MNLRGLVMKSDKKKLYSAIILLVLSASLILELSAQMMGPTADHMESGSPGSDTKAYSQGILMDTAKQVLHSFVHDLTTNPVIYDPSATPAIPTTGLRSLTRVLLAMIVPFFQVLVILTSVYIIYVSIIPRKRAYAKYYITRLLIGMVLVSVSPVIYQVMLDIEHAMLMEMFEAGSTVGPGGGPGLCTAADFTGAEGILGCLGRISTVMILIMAPLFVWPYGCIIGLAALLFIALAYAVIWLRSIVVMGLGIIFPATVFLYMWNYTQGIGKKLMRYTLIWIFMPLVQGLFVLLLVGSMDEFTVIIGSIVGLGSFIAIALSPLIMTGLMSIAGSLTVVAGAKFQSPALTGLGWFMKGYGPMALATAGSTAGYMKASLAEDARRWGGVNMVESRPSVHAGAGYRGAAAAWKRGEGVRGALKSGFFGEMPGGGGGGGGGKLLPSQARRQKFEKGGVGAKIGAVTGELVHRTVLYPAGYMLSGVFHKQSDIVPAFLREPMIKLATNLMDSPVSVRGSLRALGKSLTANPIKTAKYVGLGLALLTPVGWVGFGAAVGATVVGSYVVGKGLSLSDSSGKGFFRASYDAMKGVHRSIAVNEFRKGRLETRRQRAARGMENFKKRVEAKGGSVREVTSASGAKSYVIDQPGRLSPQEQASINTQLNKLSNESDKLDGDIFDVSKKLEDAKHDAFELESAADKHFNESSFEENKAKANALRREADATLQKNTGMSYDDIVANAEALAGPGASEAEVKAKMQDVINTNVQGRNTAEKTKKYRESMEAVGAVLHSQAREKAAAEIAAKSPVEQLTQEELRERGDHIRDSLKKSGYLDANGIPQREPTKEERRLALGLGRISAQMSGTQTGGQSKAEEREGRVSGARAGFRSSLVRNVLSRDVFHDASGLNVKDNDMNRAASEEALNRVNGTAEVGMLEAANDSVAQAEEALDTEIERRRPGKTKIRVNAIKKRARKTTDTLGEEEYLAGEETKIQADINTATEPKEKTRLQKRLKRVQGRKRKLGKKSSEGLEKLSKEGVDRGDLDAAVQAKREREELRNREVVDPLGGTYDSQGVLQPGPDKARIKVGELFDWKREYAKTRDLAARDDALTEANARFEAGDNNASPELARQYEGEWSSVNPRILTADEGVELRSEGIKTVRDLVGHDNSENRRIAWQRNRQAEQIQNRLNQDSANIGQAVYTREQDKKGNEFFAPTEHATKEHEELIGGYNKASKESRERTAAADEAGEGQVDNQGRGEIGQMLSAHGIDITSEEESGKLKAARKFNKNWRVDYEQTKNQVKEIKAMRDDALAKERSKQKAVEKGDFRQ